MEKIQTFKDLKVWQKSADVAVVIYEATESFPHAELYGITKQMRRAAISIGSNIAEGFRRRSTKEKIQFYRISQGSIAELQSQIEISFRLRFLPEKEYTTTILLLTEISKMMDGLIKSLLTTDYSLLTTSPRASRAGFTLIELVVAIGLFSLLISIAIGGFIQALRSERQTVALLSANSNVSLILEQMAREIRTARNFTTTSGSPSSDLSFTNANGEAVTYCLNSATTAIERVVSGACGSGERLTSRNVAVRSLDFITSGITAGDLYPPRITIRIALSSTGEAGVQNSIVNLQTTVSARNL